MQLLMLSPTIGFSRNGETTSATLKLRGEDALHAPEMLRKLVVFGACLPCRVHAGRNALSHLPGAPGDPRARARHAGTPSAPMSHLALFSRLRPVYPHRPRRACTAPHRTPRTPLALPRPQMSPAASLGSPCRAYTLLARSLACQR